MGRGISGSVWLVWDLSLIDYPCLKDTKSSFAGRALEDTLI